MAQLRSTPSEASVLDGDEVVCSTPCEVPYDEPRDLVFRASGHDDVAYSLTNAGTHSVTLSKKPVARRSRRRRAPVKTVAAPVTPAAAPVTPAAEPVAKPVTPVAVLPAQAGTAEPDDFDLDVEEIKNPFE